MGGASPSRNLRKTRVGIVVSDKMEKTIVVKTSRLVKHALYGKYIKRDSKFMAHDEQNRCKIGDRVKIMETRPYSRKKRWRVVKVIESKVGGEVSDTTTN